MARGSGQTQPAEKVSRSERLAYGVHAVEEALLAGEVEHLVLLEGARNEDALRLEGLAYDRDIPVKRQPERYLTSVVGRVAHQGVVAYVRPFTYLPVTFLLQVDGPLVACCGIEDPGNLGAVLRSAAGLGAGGVFVSDVGAARVTAAVRKGAAGCLHKVPLARGNVLEFFESTKAAQRPVFAAVAAGGRSVSDTPSPGSGSVLVVGSEGRGVPADVLVAADERLTIPLQRGVESLNVAVAVAILLWWATGR